MRRIFVASVVLAVGLAAPASVPAGASGQAGDRAHPGNWVTAWAASPVVGVPIPFNPGWPA